MSLAKEYAQAVNDEIMHHEDEEHEVTEFAAGAPDYQDEIDKVLSRQYANLILKQPIMTLN